MGDDNSVIIISDELKSIYNILRISIVNQITKITNSCSYESPSLNETDLKEEVYILIIYINWII